MMTRPIRVRVLSVLVELNDDTQTGVHCFFVKPKKGWRQRHLLLEGVTVEPTHRQKRHISKAVRAAIREAESMVSKPRLGCRSRGTR